MLINYKKLEREDGIATELLKAGIPKDHILFSGSVLLK